MPWTATIVGREIAGTDVRIAAELTDGTTTFQKWFSGQSIPAIVAAVNAEAAQRDAAAILFAALPNIGQTFNLTPAVPPVSTSGTYGVTASGMAKAANKYYLTVFNGDAQLVVNVVSIRLVHTIAAAVTGLVRGYSLFPITAHSGGTLATISRRDSTSPAVPAGITSRADAPGVTLFGSVPIAIASLNEEETGGGADCYLFRESEDGPLVLNPGQGIAVQQDSVAGVGNLSVLISFRVR